MASGVAGPAPDPCTGGVETHAAAGAREALFSRTRVAPTVSGHTKRSDKYARGDHRPDPRTRPEWSGSAAGRGRRPI